MAQDLEVQQEKPPNACCAELQKEHAKLLKRYSKLDELRHDFRRCTELLRGQCDAIEKDNESLKKELKELKVWKDEKVKEAGRCVDLEDEVSALQDEVRLLKQNEGCASEGANEQLKKRMAQAEEEIKQLKELLDLERRKAASEKKNAELEKNKADEASKMLEKERFKISEAQKAANAERKKAEVNRLSLEKLKKETDDMKAMMGLEKTKPEDIEKQLDAEKEKVIKERKRADLAVIKSKEQQKLAETSLKKANLEKDRADDLNRKLEQARNRVGQLEGELLEHKVSEKAEDRIMLEKLKKENDDLKSVLALERSKYEAAHKKVEVEKKKAVRERKRADLVLLKSKEQKELAETNLRKAMLEKDRADDLNRKLEEARCRAEKSELELHKHVSSVKSVQFKADKSNTGRNAVPATDVCATMLKKDIPFSPWVEKMLLGKEQNNIREKKRADSEKRKAKKQRETAEEYKKMAMEQKHCADQLSEKLEEYKLRVHKLQKELQEFRTCASNSTIRNNGVFFETDTVKLLKKQLKLEKLLAKHAKEATKIEAFRNKILQQELCHLKQDFLQFQQRFNILDKSFLLGSEGIDQLGKVGGQTTECEILVSDGHQRQHMSGIDSRMDPPYRGSNQKMLQSSAINSSSASFSDRPLVGSQESSLPIVTPANLGEDISNSKPMMSDKLQTRYDTHNDKADNLTKTPIKNSSSKRRVGSCEKKRNLDAIQSIENLYAKGENLHQQVPQKLSLQHDILKRQMDETKEESLKKTSFRELFRPPKKRKTSSEQTVVIHRQQGSGKLNDMPDSDINNSDACMPASSPGSNAIKFVGGSEDGTSNIPRHNLVVRQDFYDLVNVDYMKLLDMDNAADEYSYSRAITSPLSPLMPEVEFHWDERLEVVSSEMLVHKSSQEGLSNVTDYPVTTQTENPTHVVSDDSFPSQLQMELSSGDVSKDTTYIAASDTHCQEIHVSSGKLGMPYRSSSGNEGTIESSQNRIVSSHGGILQCFVVASCNMDNSSILRIVQTISSCMPQCSFDHSAEMFIGNIVHALSKAKVLSAREKTCVFLSVVLHEISELGLENLKNGLGDNLVQSLGSLCTKFSSALSDPAFKGMFMESLDLFELLAVLEDFLLNRKVFVCDGGVSAKSESGVTSKLNLILSGNLVMLLEEAASAHLLIAGGCLLATFCSAVDHIGFVCEMSCNIIRMQKLNPEVMLAILHAFAHICGAKYFTLQQYSMAMTMVKSLVISLEKQSLPANSTSLSLPGVGSASSILLCTNCPFSAEAVSVEDVAVMLLENVQKQCHSVSQQQDSLALVNLLVPSVQAHEEGTEEVSGLEEAIQLSSTCDENLCNFLDVISLVEVLASVMCWDWISNYLVGRICEYLELNLMEGVSAAAFILLGQLGRIGVGASGYEDPGIQKLRGWLSQFACETTFKKLTLPVQLAIITSLFGLTPIKFQDIAEGKFETPPSTSQSIPFSFIGAWFSSLDHEQRSFLRLHRATNEGNWIDSI